MLPTRPGGTSHSLGICPSHPPNPSSLHPEPRSCPGSGGQLPPAPRSLPEPPLHPPLLFPSAPSCHPSSFPKIPSGPCSGATEPRGQSRSSHTPQAVPSLDPTSPPPIPVASDTHHFVCPHDTSGCFSPWHTQRCRGQGGGRNVQRSQRESGRAGPGRLGPRTLASSLPPSLHCPPDKAPAVAPGAGEGAGLPPSPPRDTSRSWP